VTESLFKESLSKGKYEALKDENSKLKHDLTQTQQKVRLLEDQLAETHRVSKIEETESPITKKTESTKSKSKESRKTTNFFSKKGRAFRALFKGKKKVKGEAPN